MKKYCLRHGIVDHSHRCTPDGVVFSGDNQRRAYLNRKHATKSTYWRKLRLIALARDNYACTFRHKGCTQQANTVHIDPRLKGNHLAATLADCRSACRHCHGVEDGRRAHPR